MMYDYLVLFQGSVIGTYPGYSRSEVVEDVLALGFSAADIHSGAVEIRLIPSDD